MVEVKLTSCKIRLGTTFDHQRARFTHVFTGSLNFTDAPSPSSERARVFEFSSESIRGRGETASYSPIARARARANYRRLIHHVPVHYCANAPRALKIAMPETSRVTHPTHIRANGHVYIYMHVRTVAIKRASAPGLRLLYQRFYDIRLRQKARRFFI
jgi:hypothetical protein